jgi:hypothetical protein
MAIMSDSWTVVITLMPPEGTGPVLLAGAAVTVEPELDDLDLSFGHLIEEITAATVCITLVDVDGDGLPSQLLEKRVVDAVRGVFQRTPELRDWNQQVQLTATEDADPVDLDVEASRLLPDGETLGSDLIRAIEYERSVYADAHLLRAWDLESLVVDDVATLAPADREVALRRATALAGCLIHASVTVIDQLFDDIENLRATPRGESHDIESTWALSALPPRFADRYTALFAQEFLVAFVDLTTRLSSEWSPLACVAQELGLRLLLDQVEVVAESADVELEAGWREHLEELLFEDVDHEMLYDLSLDGIEDDPSIQPPGMAPMRFEDWFTPFNDDRALPLYALPDQATKTDR